MAKLTGKKLVEALKNIVATGRVSKEIADNLPEGMIQIDTNDIVNDLAAARLTEAGEAKLPKGQPTVNAPAETAVSEFTLISGFVPPESKRGFGKGGNGKSSKYPFATMDVGISFFVPVSADMPDPVKTLGSTVSNANNKYRTPTEQTQTVTRTVRGDGNKAVLDAAGNKVKEQKEVPVYKQDKKFVIRGVEAGKVYGNVTAPGNGAMITRTV